MDNELEPVVVEGVIEGKYIDIDFGDFKLSLPTQMFDQLASMMEASIEEQKRDRSMIGMILAMKAIVPFMPSMERRLREIGAGELVDPWDRRHEGKDSLAYALKWMLGFLGRAIATMDWKAEWRLDEENGRIVVESVNANTDEVSSIIEHFGKPKRYLGAPRDQGERQDDLREASTLQPEPDVPTG